MAQKFRNYCFTINNPTGKDELEVRSIPNCVCIGWQTESGSKGTPHFQGWFVIKNARTIKGLKKDLPRAHIEVMKGTIERNILYCSKPNKEFPTNSDGSEIIVIKPYEQIGDTPPGQGARSDLKTLGKDILEGRITVKQILENSPDQYHQYGRTIERIAGLREKTRFRTWETKGVWIWGETGTGKSMKAFEGFNPDTHHIWEYDDKGWQDNYSGQEIVIMDEFRDRRMKYEDLLRLLDKYPMTLNQRGKAPVSFLAKKIIITSSLPPEEVYRMENGKDSIAQLLRRIEVIQTVKDPHYVDP